MKRPPLVLSLALNGSALAQDVVPEPTLWMWGEVWQTSTYPSSTMLRRVIQPNLFYGEYEGVKFRHNGAACANWVANEILAAISAPVGSSARVNANEVAVILKGWGEDSGVCDPLHPLYDPVNNVRFFREELMTNGGDRLPDILDGSLPYDDSGFDQSRTKKTYRHPFLRNAEASGRCGYG